MVVFRKGSLRRGSTRPIDGPEQPEKQSLKLWFIGRWMGDEFGNKGCRMETICLTHLFLATTIRKAVVN